MTLQDGTKKSVHNFKLSEPFKEKLKAWKSKNNSINVISTANHDGFYASFEIKNDMLFITKLEVDDHTDQNGFCHSEVPLFEVFGRVGPVPAEWFTGELREYFYECCDEGDELSIRWYANIYVFKDGRLLETKLNQEPK